MIDVHLMISADLIARKTSLKNVNEVLAILAWFEDQSHSFAHLFLKHSYLSHAKNF